MRIVAYIVLIVLTAGLLAGFGVHGAWRQRQMLRSYQPVPASIDQNKIRSGKLGGYEPDLRFTYTARGKTYQSKRAAPLYVSGSRGWAESLTRRIQAEGSTAYYNPKDPSDAYLLPIGRFRPYGLILTGLALLGLGILPIRAGGVFAHEPVAITGGPFDWYTLTTGGSYADRVLGWSAAAGLWYLLGAVVLAHYYLSTPAPYELKSGIVAALSVVAGLWPAYRAVTAAGAAAIIGTPKIQMTQKTARLGDPIIVRIQQPFLRDTTVDEVRVALTCCRRNGLGSVRYYTSSNIVIEDRAVHAGEVIYGEFTFEVPDKKRHPSTTFARWTYPRTDWQLELTARTAKASVSIAFPIVAEKPKPAVKAA